LSTDDPPTQYAVDPPQGSPPLLMLIFRRDGAQIRKRKKGAPCGTPFLFFAKKYD
jgi:hypothetical protein